LHARKEQLLDLQDRKRDLGVYMGLIKEVLASGWGYYHSLSMASGETMSDESLRSSRESYRGLLAQLSDWNISAKALLQTWDDVSPPI